MERICKHERNYYFVLHVKKDTPKVSVWGGQLASVSRSVTRTNSAPVLQSAAGCCCLPDVVLVLPIDCHERVPCSPLAGRHQDQLLQAEVGGDAAGSHTPLKLLCQLVIQSMWPPGCGGTRIRWACWQSVDSLDLPPSLHKKGRGLPLPHVLPPAAGWFTQTSVRTPRQATPRRC